MKFGILLLLFSLVFIVKADDDSDALECYVCDDCDTVNDKTEVKSCSEIVDPTTTTSDPGSTTTTTSNPESSTTTTTSDPGSTTTTTSNPESSTTTTTSDPGSTTTTTSNPESSTTTTTSTNTKAPTTTTSTESKTTSKSSEEATQPIVQQRSSSADDFPNVQMVYRRFLRSVNLKVDDKKKFTCYKFKYQDDDTTRVKRGCVANSEDGCKVATEGFTDATGCHLCNDKDKCNSSSKIGISVVMLLGMFLITKISTN